MRTHLGTLIATALTVLLAAPAPTRADFVLGVSYTGRQVISIDPATGVGTQLGVLDPGQSPYGLAFRGQKLYTYDVAGNAIRQILPTGGPATMSYSNLGFDKAVGQAGLTFRSDGIGFLSTALDPSFNVQNDLYSFDLAAGTSRLIAHTAPTLAGLAFVGNTLFGLGKADNTLYQVNTATGATSAVGTLFADPNGPGAALGSPIESLTAGPGGVLYATLDDRLFTLSSTTGRATAIDPNPSNDTGFSSLSGIAYSAVPEPGSIVLLGLGVAASLLGLRGRRRA